MSRLVQKDKSTKWKKMSMPLIFCSCYDWTLQFFSHVCLTGCSHPLSVIFVGCCQDLKHEANSLLNLGSLAPLTAINITWHHKDGEAMEPDWRWEDWFKMGRRCTDSLMEMWSLIEDDQLQIQGQCLPSSACRRDHSQPLAIWVYNIRETKSFYIGNEKGARWVGKSRIGANWGCWGIGGGGERQLHLYMLIAFVEKRVILVFPQTWNSGFLRNEFPVSMGLLDEPNKILYG